MGYHLAHTFTDKYNNKEYKCPSEFATDLSIDLQKKNEIKARFGTKMSINTPYTIQWMIDQDYKMTESFSYKPNENFKFTWSDQCDVKKFFQKPTESGIFTYGFTVEFLHTSI